MAPEHTVIVGPSRNEVSLTIVSPDPRRYAAERVRVVDTAGVVFRFVGFRGVVGFSADAVFRREYIGDEISPKQSG